MSHIRSVLFDLNVLFDVLLERQPHFRPSAAALNLIDSGEITGYISAHAVTTLYYLLSKRTNRRKAIALTRTLLSKLLVAPITAEVIHEALESRFTDFEDAVTHQAALAAGVDAIITRNVRDFTASNIPVLLPAQLILAH